VNKITFKKTEKNNLLAYFILINGKLLPKIDRYQNYVFFSPATNKHFICFQNIFLKTEEEFHCLYKAKQLLAHLYAGKLELRGY